MQYLADHFEDVPLLLFAFSRNDRDGGSVFPAVWSAILAARAQGVGSALTNVLDIYRPDTTRAVLGLPRDRGWKLNATVAMGYPKGRWGVPPAARAYRDVPQHLGRRPRLRGQRAALEVPAVMPVVSPLYPPPPYEFRRARQTWVVYEADPRPIAALLPRGVALDGDPAVCAAWACQYPVSTFGPYLEAYLVVRVVVGGERFWYQPVIVTDAEAPMAAGREIWLWKKPPPGLVQVGRRRWAPGLGDDGRAPGGRAHHDALHGARAVG